MLRPRCERRVSLSAERRMPLGWLCEYIGHFRYKWLNYYVRMSKNVVWALHERFPLGFSRWRHSVGGAECRRTLRERRALFSLAA